MATAAITTARFSAFSRPKITAREMITTAPAVTPPMTPYLLRGSGLVTWWAASGRYLRVIPYWIRPMAMPMAARPKP